MPSRPYKRHAVPPSRAAKQYWWAVDRLAQDPNDRTAQAYRDGALLRCPDAAERCCVCGQRHSTGGRLGPCCQQKADRRAARRAELGGAA